MKQEEFEKVMKHEDWLVRDAVARHADLTKEQIERLSQDEDACVRETIKQNPLYKKSKQTKHKTG